MFDHVGTVRGVADDVERGQGEELRLETPSLASAQRFS